MNADHHDSVRRYIEVSGANPWSYQLRHARMTDITTTEMKFSYGSSLTATIPFNPPMKSLREARERLVQMDKDALKTLNRSDITLTIFIPAYVHPGHLFNFTQCILTYIVFSRAANLQPGSLLYDMLLWRVPGFAAFCLGIRPYLITIMVVIHATETSFMAKRLKRYGVDVYQTLWWKWTATCFVEGFTSFWRMDRWVQERRREKDAKKH